MTLPAKRFTRWARPIAVSLSLLNRLTERDTKMLSMDRNVPEPVRLTARRLLTKGAERRK